MKRLHAFAFVLFLAAALSALANPGMTVAVSPAIVTNDFVGQISLDITNAVPGHAVRVDRFLDVNGNGVIDAGEVAYQSFIVTNGQIALIGGIRNINVPGDEDGANNITIQTKVPYPDLSGVLDKIAAKWVYRVVDLTSGLTATNAFTTLQKTNSQGVTGKVVVAGPGTPIANCPVVLININANGGVGAMTDAGGNYTLYCAPGQYIVLPIQRGIIADQSLGFTVSSNLFTTNNLTNALADRLISGRVTDSLTSLGIAGVFIQAQTGDPGLMAVDFTDTNGDYNIEVNSGQWKAKIDGGAGANQGYVVLTNKLNANTTGGSVTNINFQLVKATAMIYGTVKDNLTNAVPGVSLDASPNSGGNGIRGASDANGNYSVAVLADTYNIGPDDNALIGLPYASTGHTNVTISNGQAVPVNITLLRVTAHLRGFVRYANGDPVTNITMAISPDFDNDGSHSLYPDAGPDGSFDAGVYAGNWRVALEVQSSFDANIAGPSLNFTVTDGVDHNNIILVVYPTTGQISGHVADNTAAPVMDLSLYGACVVNGTNYNVGGQTDTNGDYSMKVFPGTWDVGISGDVTSRGYLQPTNQQTTVTGSETKIVNFTLYTQGNASPPLLNPARVGSQFQFQVGGSISQSYRVEATTNFTTWVPLVTNVGNFFFADTNANSFPRRIYRAREWP